MTKYETAIYEIVNASFCHPTAEQIYAELKKEFGGVVLATVYNNLNKLCDEGRLRRIVIGGLPDRYDRTERHDHVICKVCGSLTDAYLDDLTSVLEEKLGADVDFYDLKIYSICPACRTSGK